MIVNAHSIAALFVDAVSAVLAAVTLFLAVRLFLARRDSGEAGPDGRSRSEDRGYLLFWMATILLGVRLLAWPFFYATLHSFVWEVEGAMCTFGVTRVVPGLTTTLEVLKPLVFLLAGLWLVLFWLHKVGSADSDMVSGRGRSIVVGWLVLVSTVVLVDSAGAAVLWARISPVVPVTCCSAVTDDPQRFTAWMPESMFGAGYQRLLWYAYYLGNALVMIWAGASWWRSRPSAKGCGKFCLGLLISLVLVNGAITLLACIESIAPTLMKKPLHHCLYCLLQFVPDAPIFTSLFILGSFAAIWVVLLHGIGYRWAEHDQLHRVTRKLLILSVICLAASIEMVTVHLLAS